MHPYAKKYGGLTLLLGVFLAIMAGAALVDRDWTVALSRHASPKLVAFMGDSIFEGEALGANDLVIFLLLGTVTIYTMGWRRPGIKRIAACRPEAGFILTSALVTGIYVVHGLKWIMGRARPDMVLAHKASFSHWFTFGPLFVTDGVFYGSFPSGHTAQTMLLMTVAIALAGNPLAKKHVCLIGRLWGALAIVLSLTMGVTRCMTLSHWLTDILGSIFLGIIIMYLLYSKVLRVPDQKRYMAHHGRLPELPRVWELILSFYFLLGTIGVMMVVLGSRGLWLGKGIGLIFLVPVGAVLLWKMWQKSTVLLRQVKLAFAESAIAPRA